MASYYYSSPYWLRSSTQKDESLKRNQSGYYYRDCYKLKKLFYLICRGSEQHQYQSAGKGDRRIRQGGYRFNIESVCSNTNR